MVHLAEGCLSDSGMLEALQACRKASRVGDLLQALRRITFRLDSGKTYLMRDTLQKHSLHLLVTVLLLSLSNLSHNFKSAWHDSSVGVSEASKLAPEQDRQSVPSNVVLSNTTLCSVVSPAIAQAVSALV